ncbi:hypothetical protein H2787_05840 [Acinetobacter baumannii]|nr:hypothetical protein H2787_05840 [Acinetobacter baumannii]
MKYPTFLLPIASATLLLQGCVSVVPLNYTPVSTNTSIPPIGQKATVSVGETMLRQGVITTYEAIEIKKGTKVAYLTFDGNAESNTFLKIGEDAESTYYKIGIMPQWNKVNPIGTLKLSKSNQPACIIQYTTGLPVCNISQEKPVEYTPKQVHVSDAKSLQQVLYYNGKVGNRINIGYREFFDNMARPAFSNDVEYDLKESKTIAYKGAIIEIMNADNQSISYKVIKNFN